MNHIEGQYGSNDPSSNANRFGARLESGENLVCVPRRKHVEISSWYSSKNQDYDGQTPRTYLRGKTWEEQYKVGLEAMRRFGVLQ